MKSILSRAGVVACVVASASCFPAYPPGYGSYASQTDSKGYEVPREVPVAPARPAYAGVDPALAVAGVAAAGLLGYAIGDSHHHHGGYYGPAYYGPACYPAPYRYGPRYYARPYRH